MLALLRVENLTVIETAEMEFSKGLNIITGETGAGKSVMLGALKLLLGERFNRTLFRDEEKKIVIEGIFGGSFDDIAPESIEQFQIEHELIIRREIDSAGKNRIYINGMLATAAQLKDIVSGLADIHGQNDNQKLLNPLCHLEFIDSYVENALLSEYAEAYKKYNEIKKELNTLKENLKNIMSQKEILEYQFNEIDGMSINPEIDNEIDSRVKMLSNMDKIRSSIGEALDMLRDGEINAHDLMARADSLVSSVAVGKETEALAENLTSACYQLSELCIGLEAVIEGQELDPDELEKLTARKYKLQDLCKKYNCTIEELAVKADDISDKLQNIFFDEKNIQKLESAMEKSEQIVAEIAEKLNDARMLVAEELSVRVEKTMEDLELKGAVFKTEFSKVDTFDSNAGLKAEFLISTNKGFQPDSLAKVASGGEISRVMLALKEVFAEADSIQTLVFDEIDTGISGFTAKRVAGKLKKISESKQVIVITHLPVVASCGDRHFHIIKSSDTGLAKTEVCLLENEEREKILAAMISGEVSESSLMQARELMKG